MADTSDLSFKDFAARLGCKPSYVTQLRKDGRLVLTDDGKRVRVAESLERIQATRNPARADVGQRHAADRAAKAAAARTDDDSAADDTDDENASDEPAGLPPSAAAGADKIGNSYQAARAVKERYLAMSAKRDYEISIGNLLPAADVRHAIAAAVTTLRTDLENLPDSAAPVLAAEADEARVRLLLADEIEHILGNLAARFEKIATENP